MIEQFPESPDSAGANAPESGGTSLELEALRERLAAAELQLEESERQRALLVEREKLLRDEVQHRVRNMLAIVRSIFARTASSGQSLEDVEDHFRGRLDALARFQLARGVDPLGTNNLEDMILDELHSFEFDDRIEIGGPEVFLSNDIAQLLGLAIHELATNAIKFGALAKVDARTQLKIAWALPDGSLRLEWHESGVPVMASVPVRSGFGREFIEQALPYQLSATTTFQLRPGGLSCILQLPLAERDKADPSFRNWL